MSPEYESLLALASASKEMAGAVRFIEDFGHCMRFYSTTATTSTGAMPAGEAIKALSSLETATSVDTAYAETDVCRERTRLEKAAIKTTVPLSATVFCAPFVGLEERHVVLQFRYQASDPPHLHTRIVGHAKLRETMAQEFADKLTEELHTTAVFGRLM